MKALRQVQGPDGCERVSGYTPIIVQPSVTPRQRPRFLVVFLTIGLIAVFVVALAPVWKETRGLLPLLRTADRGYLAAAVLAQAGVYFCLAALLREGIRAAQENGDAAVEAATTPGITALLKAGGAFLWANRALPGPALAGLATLVFVLGRDHRRPVSAPVAQACAALFYLADYAGFLVLGGLALGASFVLRHPDQSGSTALPLTPFLIAVFLVGLGGWGTWRLLRASPGTMGAGAEKAVRRFAPLLRRTDPEPLVRTTREAVERFYERWQTVQSRPGPVVRAGLWSLAMHGCEAATLWCAVGAFLPPIGSAGTGGLFRFITAILAYVAGNLAAIVSFLPAGLGLFEGAMGVVLHLRGGIPTAAAALATLFYRLLSVWLPLPVVLGTARQALVASAATPGDATNAAPPV